jgi:hypothetical protein
MVRMMKMVFQEELMKGDLMATQDISIAWKEYDLELWVL